MRERVQTYLSTLDMVEPVSEKLQSIIRMYEQVLGTEVHAAFVSEYVTEELGRVFETLWLFTDELLMEAEIARTAGENHMDFVPLRRSVRHWVIESKGYDLVEPGPDSRLSFEVWLADNRVGNLRASGQNCGELLRLGEEFIRPNLAPLASA